jgi:hypothetical protein
LVSIGECAHLLYRDGHITEVAPDRVPALRVVRPLISAPATRRPSEEQVAPVLRTVRIYALEYALIELN